MNCRLIELFKLSKKWFRASVCVLAQRLRAEHSFASVMQAVRTATNAQSSGDCGRIMIVLLTDGRANVSLAKSNEEPDAIAEGAPKPTQELLKTEVLDMAKRCGSSGFNLLVIDTENKVRPADMSPMRLWHWHAHTTKV